MQNPEGVAREKLPKAVPHHARTNHKRDDIVIGNRSRPQNMVPNTDFRDT